MKRYFSIGVLIALAALALGSCSKDIEEDVTLEERSLSHSVSFNVSMSDQTRTGLAFKFVPNWIKTDEKNNVHLFETNQGETIEGEDVKMEIEEGRHNEVAHFSAEFSNMTIIVNPPSGTSALTRAGDDGFYYTGIVAQKLDNKFIVPAVQYPDEETLIDPNADFLVGDGRKSYSVSQSEKAVDLYFLRPVAASRLAIMNIGQGSVIKTVKITSTAKLTGSASYDAINFSTGAVTFDANSGETTITLDYGAGVSIPDEATFYAYFISLTGAKPITSIEVTTDTHVYTKTVSKTLTFKTDDFKNIAVDMSKVTPTPVNPDQPKEQNITFHKNNGTITSDSFTLGSGTYELPTLDGVAEGASVSWSLSESNPEGVATLNHVGNTWTLTPVKAGIVTVSVTAGAVEGFKETTKSFVLTVSNAAPQELSFTPESLTVTLGDDEFTEPVLSGAINAVTYSIDHTNVATIDENTGKLTLVAAGTATVTATAAAGTTGGTYYAEATATYDLTVNAPASAVKYYKVDEIVAGQEYIVVSNGQALTVNGTTVGAVAVEDNDGVIETSASVALWTAAEHVEYYSGTSAAGHYTLKNGDNYLQRLSNQSAQTVTVGAVPSTGKYYVWEYDGTHLYHLSSASNTFYMGYSDGWKFNYQTPYYEASLYSTTKPLTKQTIAFVAETVQYDLNGGTGTVQAPAWSEGNEPKTTVAYASDSEVITVNATTGVVSVSSAAKVGDSATITATAEQTTEYASATATFTVVVIDSTPVEETTYTLVTGALTPGTYILISDDSSTSYNNRYTVALFPTVVTTSWQGSTPVDNGQRFNEKDVTLSGNSIVTDDAEIVGAEVELEASGSGWKIKAKKTGEYLVVPTQSYRIPLSTNAADAAVFTISTAQNRSLTTTGSYYFFHSGSATGFTIRNTNTAVSNVRFYQKAKKTQTLSFSAETAQYDLKDGSWDPAMPTLDKTGAVTEVTCTSSDETVATVNANGVVTIASGAKKGDTAVITAEAPANDEYDAATASYTLSIVDTTPGVMATYKKVTSTAGLVAGAKYLLVFEGLAGDADGDGNPKVFSAELNSDGSQFAKATASALDVTIASSTIESDQFGDCLFTLESGYYLKGDRANKYIYPGTSGSSSVMLAESTASHALTITFDEGIAQIMYRSNSQNRYLVWSTSSHYFSCNTAVSGSWSTGICLYKLDDGTTPTPAEQTIAFTPATAQYDLYTKAWTPSQPVLGGAQTTVTYESSDPTVATVAADGTITPLKVGEVTVTANAAATAAYQAATTTCTVTITDSTPVTPPTTSTYTLIEGDANLATGTYVIADKTNTYLLNASGSNNGGYSTINSTTGVTRSGSTITLASDVAGAHEFVITRTGDNLTVKKVGGDHADQYLFASTTVSNSFMGFQSTAATFVLNKQTNTDLIYFSTTKSSTSPTEYLYKKAADSYFKLGQSGAPGGSDAGVYLYKLDGGTTPVDPEPPTPTTQYYTKINSRDDLPSATQTSATGDYLFVYESGSKAYVFKAICDGTPTGAGNQANNHVELTKTGSAIEVDLTADGIAATDAVKDCKIQLAHHSTASRNDWNIKPNRIDPYWIRVNNGGSSTGVRILAMTSAGYSATFTFNGTGNNLEIKRTDSNRDAYWSYNATDNCFEGTSTASKISIYKLSE